MYEMKEGGGLGGGGEGEGGLLVRLLTTSGIELDLTRARICKRLRSRGIDSEEPIPAGFVAGRAGTTNMVVVPTRQVRNRFLGSIKGLRIRVQISIRSDNYLYCTVSSLQKVDIYRCFYYIVEDRVEVYFKYIFMIYVSRYYGPCVAVNLCRYVEKSTKCVRNKKCANSFWE